MSWQVLVAYVDGYRSLTVLVGCDFKLFGMQTGRMGYIHAVVDIAWP